jgi:AraC-like DNA-binding protein
VTEPASGQTIGRIVVSSHELPAELDDRARYLLWRDLYAARDGRLELTRSDNALFSARVEFASFGGVGLLQFEGTVNRVTRSADAIGVHASENFCLLFNRSRSPMMSFHRGRQAALAPGAPTLYIESEVAELRGEAENAWCALVAPRRALLDRVFQAEDMAATAIDPDQPATRYLRRYVEMLSAPESVGTDLLLIEHIDTTLLDLIGLALGASRDVAGVAYGRGLRAARLVEIMAEIRSRFADPAFSPRDVALKLRLTPRYVQELLSATGASFTERVLELRLQKARTMLASPPHDRLRVSEIAYASGFNDISYFNRCFRRRFGASPLQYRASNGER